MRALHRFGAAENGGVSVITAVTMVSLIGFAGFATDLGSVYLETRRLQGAADLAAISASQNFSQASELAAATITANNWPANTRVNATLGSYNADRTVAARSRFQAGGANINAVRVDVQSSAPLYFSRIFLPSDRMTIHRTATAAQTRMASFQIGSRLMSLRGGVANQLLTGLTGSSVSLSVMDYNALLGAQVNLLSYVEALRTRLDLEAATFDRALSTEADTGVALEALADTVSESDAQAEHALRALAQSAGRTTSKLRLNEVVDLGPYSSQDHDDGLGIQVNAMDLATAILEIAGGNRQVRLQLGADVPGLTSTNAWLAIGERPNNSPWLAVTNDEAVIIRTAQTRLYVESTVRAGVLNVRIPALIELASAQARLEDISCSADGSRRNVTLAVSPSIGSMTLGEVNTAQLDNFRVPLRPAPAQLVNALGLARVDGSANVNLGGESWTNVSFTASDIDRGTVKSVATRDAAQATVSTLLGRTNLTVRTLGLGVSTSAITSLVRGALTSAAAPLDGLVNGLTDLLGIRLGEADVRVNGVRCTGASLVA